MIYTFFGKSIIYTNLSIKPELKTYSSSKVSRELIRQAIRNRRCEWIRFLSLKDVHEFVQRSDVRRAN